MWTKLIRFISPLGRYITFIGVVVAFLAGGYVARTYYVGKINANEALYAQKETEYLRQIVKLDNIYTSQIQLINGKLKVVNEALKHETTKQDYKCPIPDTGIQLLNDAINSGKGGVSE